MERSRVKLLGGGGEQMGHQIMRFMIIVCDRYSTMDTFLFFFFVCLFYNQNMLFSVSIVTPFGSHSGPVDLTAGHRPRSTTPVVVPRGNAEGPARTIKPGNQLKMCAYPGHRWRLIGVIIDNGQTASDGPTIDQNPLPSPISDAPPPPAHRFIHHYTVIKELSRIDFLKGKFDKGVGAG